MLGSNWFECSVKVDRNQMIGQEDNYSGNYLVDALTCGEAEKRVMEEVGMYCNGALAITGVKNTKINELFLSEDENADKWYKAKVMSVTMDEKTEKEKKTAVTMVVQANNFDDALNRLKDGMRGSMMDYEIDTIQRAKILDVFPFSADHIAENADADVPESKNLTVDLTTGNDSDTTVAE